MLKYSIVRTTIGIETKKIESPPEVAPQKSALLTAIAELYGCMSQQYKHHICIVCVSDSSTVISTLIIIQSLLSTYYKSFKYITYCNIFYPGCFPRIMFQFLMSNFVYVLILSLSLCWCYSQD